MIRLCLGNHIQKYVPNPCRNSPVAGISVFSQILTWTSSETAPRNTFSVGSGEGPRSGRRRKGCDPGLPILWGFLKPWGTSEPCNIGNVWGLSWWKAMVFGCFWGPPIDPIDFYWRGVWRMVGIPLIAIFKGKMVIDHWMEWPEGHLHWGMMSQHLPLFGGGLIRMISDTIYLQLFL